MRRLAAAVIVFILHAAKVKVDWDACPVQRSASPSLLVAADPEFLKGAKMYDAAVAGIKGLVHEGADYIRLLNFNIFPGLSCALLTPGKWDFAAMDEVMASFKGATGNASVIIDIETAPAWMWENTCFNISNQTLCVNNTCANNVSDTLPISRRVRCPYYGEAHMPRDKSWREIADYFTRVADWYTKGKFTDEQGLVHHSPQRYKIDYWEVLNEVNGKREHNLTPQQLVDVYDAQVKSMGRRQGMKYAGSSFAGMSNPHTVDEYVGALLNRSNHHPPDTPLDALTFHIYAGPCANRTLQGMEAIFPLTDTKINGLKRIEELRLKLRPEVELHLTESGTYCNAPRDCPSNGYQCWYQSFDPTYWVASASQWLYQYLTYTKAVDLTSVAQSQLLGYPYQYDGLSGEWASGTMVDFERPGELNAKYWVEILALQQIGRPFKYCATTMAAPSDVYVQGLSSAKGRVVVAINKRASPRSVEIAGAKGKTAWVIDLSTGNSKAREVAIEADEITLPAFATMFVQW
jgi:hypothetical protein